MMIPFSIIAALDSERGIGKAGRLPWKLSGDLKHFKKLTTRSGADSKENAVIMGRKTWESLPERFRPLPNRINVVLTKNKKPALPATVLCSDVLFSNSLDTALRDLANRPEAAQCFVIGGQQIFEAALRSPLCEKLYLTHILKSFQCDTFFPSFEDRFEPVYASPENQENEIRYYFSEYKTKSP